MSQNTGIQWTDATWNPIRGCSRVSEGCRNCYAEAVAARFSGPGQAYEGLARRTSNGAPRWTGKIMFVEKHLLDPLRWKKPSRIFVNSMSDLFHDGVTRDQLAAIFGVMAIAHQPTFQVLTKRPEQMRDVVTNLTVAECIAGLGILCEQRGVRLNYDRVNEHLKTYAHTWPLQNVWLGVSVEDQETVDERIPLLLDTPAAKRFLSCEPLLGPLDFPLPCIGSRFWGGLHWVIIGGESGPNARPCDTQWIRNIVDQCTKAGVAPFVKQLGAYPVNGSFTMKLEDSHGGNPEEWAPFLRVREFPGVAA
jgi:protein gp37